MKRILFSFLFCVLVLVPASNALAENIVTRFGSRIKDVFVSEGYDVLLPVLMWHNRAMYDDVTSNEVPWGIGIGKSMFDAEGDSHMLFAMGFSDSNKDFQPFIGYGLLYNWRPVDETDFRLGGGFILGITARKHWDPMPDGFSYVPFPAALPAVGVGYKSFDAVFTYIPWVRNNGNVLFGILKYHF